MKYELLFQSSHFEDLRRKGESSVLQFSDMAIIMVYESLEG